MDGMSELREAVSLGLESFKLYIQKKLQEEHNLLQQAFWIRPDGTQLTILNYLIDEHHELDNQELYDSSKDLVPLIDYIMSLTVDKNAGEPLHQALVLGKTKLALHLLDGIKRNRLQDSSRSPTTELFVTLKNIAQTISERISEFFFDVDRRDKKGRTLISLALNTKDTDLLLNILAREPNIHAVTSMTNAQVDFQPIHQAVTLDYADAVRLLAHQGAQLANPLGAMCDTPLILAARLGKVNAMEALLEQPIAKLMLEATNNHIQADGGGLTAIEELCLRITNSDRAEEALRQVAMLLARGAEPPRDETMCRLLSKNRIALLQAVEKYLEDKPELVIPFVTRCHLKASALHNIMYADHSWGSSFRHLFGIPSKAALIIENLVIRKMPSLIAPEAKFALKDDPIILYAAFVAKYEAAYQSQKIPNRWSTMRWEISEGNADWSSVYQYARIHPASRTRIICGEMFQPMHALQEEEPKGDKGIAVSPSR